MYRIVCLFHYSPQQGLQFLIRLRSDRWIDTNSDALQTENFYTVGVCSLTTVDIENAVQAELNAGSATFTVKGIAREATAYDGEGSQIYHTFFASILVSDQAFRQRLPHPECYMWCSSAEVLSHTTIGKISPFVTGAVKAIESGLILPMSGIHSGDLNVADVVKMYENLFTDHHRMMLREAGFGQRQMAKLYEMFLDIVWPQHVMSFEDFELFFKKHEMRHGSDLRSLYRTFNISGEEGIPFFDFLFGMAVVQPQTPHKRLLADIRTRYIFRYYCVDCDSEQGRLTKTEIELLLNDINRMKNATTPINNADLVNSDLDRSRFLRKVSALKIRGTSSLLRLHRPTFVEGHIDDAKAKKQTEAVAKKPEEVEIVPYALWMSVGDQNNNEYQPIQEVYETSERTKNALNNKIMFMDNEMYRMVSM
ncbi:hypothetical protein QR680_014865 [Steinernema hermaphroditum]|uniref:Uncharacterized protein n=1 Tax=Steinernema hermaphroditum TaxID=289476 RepID=A0AA39M4Z8_9BILA|nr:hypothetical protein QR680_014865 [Steinernema hermaphroditum]